MPQRRYIQTALEGVEDVNETKAKRIGLMYGLHIIKRKESYIDMFNKGVIEDLSIDLTEEMLKTLNPLLNKKLEEIDMPTLSLDLDLLTNASMYSDSIKQQLELLHKRDV